jgi:hypothetical protein
VKDRGGKVLHDAHVLLAGSGKRLGDFLGRGCRETVLGLPAIFGHRHGIPRETQDPVLKDDPPALAGNFEAIRTRRLTGGRDKRGVGSARHLEIGGHVVLDLDFMVTTEIAEAVHAFRETKDPLEKIEVMRALVEQNTAALARPTGPPAAG